MSITIDELREMYTEERETSKALRGVIDRQDKRIDRLVNQNNRLGDELRSARNDNELTRSVGEGMQSFENDQESQRERLDAANASIEEIQHSKKELDQELRTERRRTAELQASLEQAQDAKAELEESLQRMQHAWDEGDRARASGYAERSHEPEERYAEKEKNLQEWEKRLQEREKRLQEREKRLQEKEQSLQRNQRSSTRAVAPIKTERLARPNLRLNPRAVAFRPTDSKSMAQVAVRPRPPVIPEPEVDDETLAFMMRVNAERAAFEKAEAAKADAIAKSKVSDATTGKRKFEEDDEFSAQQSGPSSSEAGEKKKLFLR